MQSAMRSWGVTHEEKKARKHSEPFEQMECEFSSPGDSKVHFSTCQLPPRSGWIRLDQAYPLRAHREAVSRMDHGDCKASNLLWSNQSDLVPATTIGQL